MTKKKPFHPKRDAIKQPWKKTPTEKRREREELKNAPQWIQDSLKRKREREAAIEKERVQERKQKQSLNKKPKGEEKSLTKSPKKALARTAEEVTKSLQKITKRNKQEKRKK